MIKYIYSYFVNNLIYIEYNYINKFYFLDYYQYIQLEIFQQPAIFQNSFAANSLILVDIEQIFSKLNIFLRISIPSENWPNKRFSQFISKILKTVIQPWKQTSILKDLLKQYSNSSPSLSKTILDQIIKNHYIVLYITALLTNKVTNL